MRQVAATENSVVLAWTPSSDNVGVVEYGLYASGLRVATVSEPSATLTSLQCGTSYLIAIDAADAAGNRSAQASAFYRTSACPSTNKPPTTPTVVKVTAATADHVSLCPGPPPPTTSRVTGYGLYLSGSRTSETTGTTGEFTGLKCGTTYALGVDAKDAAGLRSAVASSLHRNLALLTRRRRARRVRSPRRSRTGRRSRISSTGVAVYDTQRRQGRGRPRQDRVPRRRQPRAHRDRRSRSVTASPTGRHHRHATASTPSRCAPSTTPAPCSPPTPSPPPSPTTTPPPPPSSTGCDDADDRERVDDHGSR